eukprot:scaffold3571_cov176-Amphora_coffeaeformis.AAC.13
MWGAFNALAEQAKKAAAELEGQINESVGVEVPNPESTTAESKEVQDGDDDDVWKDDDFDLDTSGLDTTNLPTSNGHNSQEAVPATATTAQSLPAVEHTKPIMEIHENGVHEKLTVKPPEDDPVAQDDGGWAQEDDDLEFDDTEAAPEEEGEPAKIEPVSQEELSPLSKESPDPEPVAMAPEAEVDHVDDTADGGDGWQEELDIDDSEQAADENEVEAEKADVVSADEEKIKESTTDEKGSELPTTEQSPDTVEDKPTHTPEEKVADTPEEEMVLEPAVNDEKEEEVFPEAANDTHSQPEGIVTEPSMTEAVEKEPLAEEKSCAFVQSAAELEPDMATAQVQSQPEQEENIGTEMEESIAQKDSDSFEAVVKEKEEPTPDTTSQNEAPSIGRNDTNSFDTTDASVPMDIVKENASFESKPVETAAVVPESPAPTAEALPEAPAAESAEVPKAAIPASTEDEMALQQYQQLVERLQTELQQRELQLFSKTEQMTSMQAMFEAEKQELVQMVEHTKAEAKRRIQMAKERVEKAEARAAQLSRGQSEDSQKQAEIINELRSEGEKLAHKQAEMERAVRSAKGEARKFREGLEIEQAAKEEAFYTIEELRGELKATKEQLALARKGESQASKLDTELQSVREDAERKASTILSLEQQVKELKTGTKELMVELEAARKGAALETEREHKKLRKEQSNLIDDFETKLRTAEKEAALREDALRLEVNELRKRWQDAVRRADALSMDVQSSTAPLMRQLESMERQNRSRAAAWTELETKLREELEETVIANERLVKEKTEMKTKLTRIERSSKDNEAELRAAQNELEEKTYKVKELEDKLLHLEEEGAKRKKEYAEVERLANEGVARVRSEMSQTMLEADERHRAQVDSLQAELRVEREKRSQLEHQVQDLVDKAGSFVHTNTQTQTMHRANSAPTPKLRKSEGQAQILAGALNGYSDDELDDDEDDGDEVDAPNNARTSSFAALEELTSRLKSTKVELNTLRKSLEESEKNRTNLMDELSEARAAREKLPLFEARVRELTAENEQMSREIQGLQADIADVRELYRAQLNALLEEKATVLSQDNNTHTVQEGLENSGALVEDEVAPEPSESENSVPAEILEV